MSRAFLAILLLVCVVIPLSVGGVYATWHYTSGDVKDLSVDLQLHVFPWQGSDILPEDSEEGLNHRALIATIIDGEGIGLNTKNSYLNEEIDGRMSGSLFIPKRDTLGSMAVTQGSELNELFNLDTHNIAFLIHMKSDTEYHIYTTSVYLGERGEINWTGSNKTPGKPTTPIGEYISPIYRTVVVYEDGAWRATETKVGKAKSAWYDESRSNSNKNGTQIPSFSPSSWIEEAEG